MKIDNQRLVARRRRAGISQRALARAAGPTYTTIISLEETGDASYLQCGVLDRIAQTLGMPVADLLASRPSEEAADASIGSALWSAGPGGLSADAVAVALDITADDVLAAVEAIRERLNPCGMTVTHADRRLALAPTDRQGLTDEAMQAADRRMTGRERVNREGVQAVYAVQHGATMTEVEPNANKRRLDAGRLAAAGIIEEPDDGRTRLTEDVLFSLMLA